MSGLIEVLDGGVGNSIQDAGRFGFRHMGVAVSGALDPVLARCANALVDNDSGSACIEVRALGPTLLVRHGRVRVALAGDLTARLKRANGAVFDVLPWRSMVLFPHDVLEIASLHGGTAYLAVAGGINSPVQLGSRSTYQRALIGGVDGGVLATGNLLPCASQDHLCHREYQSAPWRCPDGPVRVMLGPQHGHFTPESIDNFLKADYQVTAQIDRMGMRLEGVVLQHICPEAADIVSDGVTPGAIQVPGNGQPIILLADCQTVGGYPKIATVISADLYRLAQAAPGQSIRFSAVSDADARQALLEREAQWDAWVSEIAFGLPNPRALYNDLSSVWIPEESGA